MKRRRGPQGKQTEILEERSGPNNKKQKYDGLINCDTKWKLDECAGHGMLKRALFDVGFDVHTAPDESMRKSEYEPLWRKPGFENRAFITINCKDCRCIVYSNPQWRHSGLLCIYWKTPNAESDAGLAAAMKHAIIERGDKISSSRNKIVNVSA